MTRTNRKHSGGTQDLIVNILSLGQRYEAANYENVSIPTNIDVADATKQSFPGFYTALFDKTVEKHPHAVVTEYSWMAQSCDPCPTPPLDQADMMTLGGDVLSSTQQQGPRSPFGGALNGMVVTRLHARYSKDALGDDLFFRAAPPIVGGREFMQSDGKLEQGSRPDATNNFQARYVIRHPWRGPIACKNPQRGIWGGPPGQGGNAPPVKPASKIAFAPRGTVQLNTLLSGPLPPENVLSAAGPTPVLAMGGPAGGAGTDAAAPPAETTSAGPAPSASSPAVPATAPQSGGCAGCSAGGSAGRAGATLLAGLLVVAFGIRRVRRRV